MSNPPRTRVSNRMSPELRRRTGSVALLEARTRRQSSILPSLRGQSTTTTSAAASAPLISVAARTRSRIASRTATSIVTPRAQNSRNVNIRHFSMSVNEISSMNTLGTVEANSNNIPPGTEESLLSRSHNEEYSSDPPQSKEDRSPPRSPGLEITLSQAPPSPPTLLPCPVCFTEMFPTSDCRISSLTCGHVFCETCIIKCYNQNRVCPLCLKRFSRRDIKPIYLQNF